MLVLDVLRDLRFNPCKAEQDIWMRETEGLYEYIRVYVDDLLIAAKDPEQIIKALREVHKFKLKGVGPLVYHLGCDYFRDKDGTLCYGPRKHISKMISDFEMMFGCKPREYMSPLEKDDDHPKIDTTKEFDLNGIKKYIAMIGCIQWTVSLGRFDILTSTMAMSRFRSATR